MSLAWRLTRALFLFAVILGSYLLQLGLVRVFRRRSPGEGGGPPRRRVPEWLKRRRARVDLANARRLMKGILKLRGVYIKMGQVLSIMGGFLPKAFGAELEALQDNVPPHPFRDVEQAFLRAFGKSPEECFGSIEREPIAAASLGQVHVAYAKDGRKLAVKVLYPNIREIIRVDMRVLALAVRVYKWWLPITNLENIHAQLVDLLARETDYLHEAACMERMAKNFADEPDILFPSVVHEWTTREVLTMTFMEGIKITRVEELTARGVDCTLVATRLVQSFYKQLFVDRFFHADPHPGNFLVQPPTRPGEGPKIVVLDFGAITEVQPELVDGALDILQGLFTKDGEQVLRGFRRMGFVSQEGNKALLEQTVMTYFQRLLKIENRSAGALIRTKPKDLERLADPALERQELRDLMRSITYPEGWFYVERASVLAFWLSGQIAPELDTMTVGLPYVMPLVMQRQLSAAVA